ncbi:hypothetical protein KHQ84_gp095 [Rhodococcus phage Finch]|uniref:Uncharacterized protein n=1 Tax=Rhodococcus phage Finch TaxID=2094144 RepID=A0A2P1JXF4_9CAUD|nr:hypothetical protein KHQ84_gp095 [Rhodococcus phage Finch]AVO25027.1 hypothetical protein SEA_FINCH_95 [Rhodococcus phage Finch]
MSTNIPGTSVPDLSALRSHLPPAELHNAMPTREQGENAFGYDVLDLTPTEGNLLEASMLAASNKWLRKEFTEENKEAFEREVQNRANELGFVLHIEWEAYQADGMPGTAYVPNVVIVARIEKTEIDHDLISAETKAGLYDGKVGGIREDGSWREDSRKKSY